MKKTPQPSLNTPPDSGRTYLVHLTSAEAEALDELLSDTGLQAGAWLAVAASTAIESAEQDDDYQETMHRMAIDRDPLHPLRNGNVAR